MPRKVVIHEKGPIQLRSGDAAWVVRADGSMELHVPDDLEGDDEAPKSIVTLAAYATLHGRDPRLAEKIVEDFDKQTDGPDWGEA